MRPYLFPEGSTSFLGGAFGSFSKCISCTVRQELGSTGVYELNAQILTDDPIFKNVSIGQIVVVKPNLTDGNQAFVIEQLTKPIDNIVTVYATHIAQHRAKLIPVAPVSASSLQEALTNIISNSLETNPFSLTSDRTSNVAYQTNTPRSFRDILGGSEGSLLDVYGGEYIFDNFNIKLVNKRGRNNGVQVLYGQSMTSFDLNEEFGWGQSVTGILPYWFSDTDGLVQGSVQYSDYVKRFKYRKSVAVDYSDQFEAKPTVSQLNTRAKADVKTLGYPVSNLSIAFNQFEDHIQGQVQTMQLGDAVQIINPNYSVNTTSRIVAMTFDVLGEMYESIEVGELQQNINQSISDVIQSSSGIDPVYPFISGNSISFDNSWIEPGYVSSSSTALVFMIHLPKPISASSVTIDSMIVRIRSSENGYILLDTDIMALADCTISAQIINGMAIRVRIVKTSAWTISGTVVSNNSLIVTEIVSGSTITFK